MAITTPLEIVQSYIDLLIMQYLGKPNASATIDALVSPAVIPQTSVQTITFSATPSSGTFVLTYGEENTSALNWNATATDVQTALRLLTGLSTVIVTGLITSAVGLTVSFEGVAPPADSLSVFSNTLFNGGSVSITIAETDLTLPLAVQDAFNLIEGTGVATGAQLDILGKYAGVSRTGLGFTQSITLDDADYYRLIQMAIVLNSAGSSLATIQDFLLLFFPGEIFVFDYQDMTMSYIISQGIGSPDLVQLFVTEGLLPVPMAVGVTVFNPISAKLFSFRTYEAESSGFPFNDYIDYNQTWTWLSYHDLVA